MSGWIEVKKDKKKKGDSSAHAEERSSLPAAGGQAAIRAVFWGETTKKAAAKLEAYDREQGRHGDAIVHEAETQVAKPTGIPNAEAIGASFTWTRVANVLNPLKQRLKLNPPPPFSEVDSIVRQIVNMLESDFRKATDCKWPKLINTWLYQNKGVSADQMPLGLIGDVAARKELVDTLHSLPKDSVPVIMRDYLFSHFFRASMPDPKKKLVEGDAHLGAKIVIQILLQKWPGAIDQAFSLNDLPSGVVPFAGTILAPNLHHDKQSLAWVLKQLSVHTKDHCLALWAKIVDDCFSGKSVESDPLNPLQQVAFYLIGDKGNMRSFGSTSVDTLLALYRIASHGSPQDSMAQKISVLAASAAKNAIDTFKAGDLRFDVASTIAIAQCKFGSALAAEPAMRLLAMAVLSVGTDHLPAINPHVKDKNALIAAVEAINHHLRDSVVQSLRDIMHKDSAHGHKNSNAAATHARASNGAPSKSAGGGGFGMKHVILALAVSGIGGYICISNKCSGFCANFHAICDAWNGKL